MSISLYEIYANNCKELARSIIIKSDATAEAINLADQEINHYLVSIGEPPFLLKNDKTTWRYYMHMAGMYHALDRFDTINEDGTVTSKKYMQVYSLDTYELIDFTIENLKEHRTTWREYQKGSSYYRNLVNKYPDKRLLIDGILNPIDIHEAIRARDNKILYWDKRWVEENEYSLINNIQDFIDKFYSRWDNMDYIITDNLYVPARIGVLYGYLPMVIMDLRYNKSRTIEAHSFHVWAYLGSHQWLDEYKYHLNLYQRLWFYRNIRWSEINAGKTDTFEKHIDVIMTNRNLPIAGFDTRSIVTGMDDDNRMMYPEVDFKRIPLNMFGSITKAEPYRSISTMVHSEVVAARDNNLFIEEDIQNIRYLLPRMPDKSLPTKVLESLAADSSKRSAIKYIETGINEWINLTVNNMYKARISVENPVESGFLNMSQDEALVVFLYALSKSNGIEPKYIHDVTVHNVLRLKKPKLEQLRKLSDRPTTCLLYIQAANHYAFEPTRILSTERFVEHLRNVVKLRNLHRQLYSFTQDAWEHIQVKVATMAHYETVTHKLVDEPTKFSEYFKYRGWELADTPESIAKSGARWTTSHYSKLMTDIVNKALGEDLLSKINILDVQGMMVRLLKKLSSYSIQFIKQSSDDEIYVADWPYLRYHGLGTRTRSLTHHRLTVLRVRNYTAGGDHKYEDTLIGKWIKPSDVTSSSEGKNNANLILDMNNIGRGKNVSRIKLPSVQFRSLGSKLIDLDVPPGNGNNTWEMDKFKVHKTTEDRSLVEVDDDGTLIVRGVTYVKGDYKGNVDEDNNP